MDVIREETPWWRLNNHKRIRGPRGARYGTGYMHVGLAAITIGAALYISRGDPDPHPRFTEPPPCPPPPKPASALSYTKVREMPLLQRRLLEEKPPAHLPHPNVDTVIARELERPSVAPVSSSGSLGRM